METIKNLLLKDSKNCNDLGLLLFRAVVSLALFYGHGMGKLSKIFAGQEIQFMDPLGIGASLSFYMAAFAEGICALFLLMGLLSRFASLMLVGNFLVIFFFHAFLQNEGFDGLELIYLYLIPFIALTLTGAGKYSLDHYLLKAS